MEDLYNYAIVILYSDGQIEKIPIESSTYHLDYLKRNLKRSSNFSKIIQGGGLNFKELANHIPVDKILIPEGNVIIYNVNIKKMIENPNESRKELANFQVFAPFEFKSLIQVSYLKKFLEIYRNKLFHIALNIPGTTDFVTSDYDTLNNLLRDSKEILQDKLKR